MRGLLGVLGVDCIDLTDQTAQLWNVVNQTLQVKKKANVNEK